MKLSRVLAAGLFAGHALSCGAIGFGTVEGRVVLTDGGTARSGASDVVVWLEGLHSSAALSGKETEMKSLHKRFVPRTVAVGTGQAVAFPNEDGIFHNVFSVSGENHFDLGLYRRGKSREKKFETSGLVRVYCNIHPQMIGYVRVVDSSFYAVTQSDGAFRFENVPEGPHTVKAWFDEAGEVSASVTVRPGARAPASLTLDASGFKPQPHKNKYGQDYPPPPPDEDRY
jgi:plastocyanin